MNFLTFFDKNYLPKGMVCYKTLCNYNLNKLYVACLDDITYNEVSKWDRAVAIKLSDIEDFDSEYKLTKTTRSSTAYYITLSPVLPLYVFDKFDVELISYTDADIAFWSDPKEIFDVMGDKSLMITDHGFEPPRGGIRFNNGIIGYRNDDNSKQFLKWWRERCLEWCNWSTENGKCGEQGYLNIIYDQPDLFKNTLICPTPGINLGPWNVWRYTACIENDKIMISNEKKYTLVCYHYHEFRYINSSSYYPTGWKHNEEHRKLIYEPYFKLIKEARSILGFTQDKIDLTNIGK